jgi:hypothetical protein
MACRGHDRRDGASGQAADGGRSYPEVVQTRDDVRCIGRRRIAMLGLRLLASAVSAGVEQDQAQIHHAIHPTLHLPNIARTHEPVEEDERLTLADDLVVDDNAQGRVFGMPNVPRSVDAVEC